MLQLSQDGPLYIILRSHRLYFPQNIMFYSLKIVFALANSAGPDEVPHNAAFHLGLHCLPKYIFIGLCPQRMGAQWLSGRVLDSRPRGLWVRASPASLHCGP